MTFLSQNLTQKLTLNILNYRSKDFFRIFWRDQCRNQIHPRINHLHQLNEQIVD